MVATPASLTGAYVGTSGFGYSSWKGGFYPEKAKPSEFLEFFAARLPSVELNTSFYQLPAEEQFRAWAEQTPAAFRFAVKMTGRITHSGRLALIQTFCERVRLLGERLGPILVQFPETRARDDGLLRLLLDSLDPELEYAFEFRHESWDGAEVPLRINAFDGDAAFRYFRLREPPYDDDALHEWAARFRLLLDSGLRLYCYFKPQHAQTASSDATRLPELLQYV